MKKCKKLLAFLVMLVTVFATQTVASATTSTETVSAEQSTENQQATKAKEKKGEINTEDFSIKVLWGLEGNSRVGAPFPIAVNIESLKGDFQGVVRIITPEVEYETNSYAYEQEVLLSEKTPKNVYMALQNIGEMTTFKFEIDDENGKTILSKEISTNMKFGQDALVGILSDDYTAFGFMDKLDISVGNYSGRTSILELNEDNLPEMYSSIASLSYLIIDNYDTSKLSKNQFDAIKKWVELGGVLVVGTGSNYQQTLSAFVEDSEMLSGTVNGVKAGLLMSKDSSYEALEFSADSGFLDIKIDDGKSLKEVSADDNVVIEKTYNEGKIIVTAFDMGLEPFASWSSKEEFAKEVFEASSKDSNHLSKVNYGEDYYYDNYSSDYLISEYKGESPNIVILTIIMLLFILLSPLGYVILKKMDKRGWIWVLFPASAIVCTVLILLATANVRIKHPVASSLTSYYSDCDGDSQKRVQISVMVPSSNEEIIDMSDELINPKIAASDSMSTSLSGRFTSIVSRIGDKYEYRTAVRDTAEGYVFRVNNKSTFGTNNYTFDSKETKFDVPLETNYVRTINGISGSVKNVSDKDIKYVSVFIYGKIVPLGNIKAGQTVEFKEDDNKMCYNSDWYNIQIPGVKKDSWEQNEAYSLYDYAYSSYMSGYYSGSDDQMSAYAVGYLVGDKEDFIKDKNIKEKNASIIVKRDKVKIKGYDNAVMLNPASYAQSSGSWDPYDGQMYDTEAVETFDLGNEINTIYAITRAKDSEARYGKTSNTVVYFWNYETNKYDNVFSKDLTIKFKGKCPYINDVGVVQIKFTCNTKDEDYAPSLTILGGAK